MTKARDLANIISGSGTLNANVIPALPASKITSGTFDDARLSASSVTQYVDLTSLSADNLTSGTVPSARLSLSASDVPDLAATKITSGTFADARISSSSVTAHVDLSNLDASNLTSGTIPNARYGTPTFNGSNLTNMSVASTVGAWTPGLQVGSTNSVTARYVKVGRICFCRCSFYMTNSQSSQSGTLLKITGLPFTATSGNTYAGQGVMRGPSYRHDGAHPVVEAGGTTCVIIAQGEDRSPYANIDNNGALVRRHSLIDGYDKYYNIMFTYVTAS